MEQTKQNSKYYTLFIDPTSLNLECYTLLFLDSMNDENFKKYIQFTILMNYPQFNLLSKEIQKKAYEHCKKHLDKYGYD